MSREDGLEREHGPRQFASAGHFAKRTGRFAGVRREHQLEVFRSARGHIPLGRQRHRLQHGIELRLGHAEIGEVLFGFADEFLRDLGPRLAQRGRGILQLREGFLQCLLNSREVVFLLLEPGLLRIQRIAILEEFVRRLPVAGLQLLEEPEARFHFTKALGVGLEPLG